MKSLRDKQLDQYLRMKSLRDKQASEARKAHREAILKKILAQAPTPHSKHYRNSNSMDSTNGRVQGSPLHPEAPAYVQRRAGDLPSAVTLLPPQPACPSPRPSPRPRPCPQSTFPREVGSFVKPPTMDKETQTSLDAPPPFVM